MKKALLCLILLSVLSVNLMAQNQENELSDISYLNLLESPFGSIRANAHNNGNEVICEKNSKSHCFGWILKDVDLSQYDKIRIEIGKNGLSGRLYLILEVNGKIYSYYHPAEQNVWEANLNGENASEIFEDEASKKGEIKIFFNTWNMGPLYQEEKFEVVSVQLLNGKYEPNRKYSLLGKDFGSCQDYVMIYSDGTVEWASARRQPYPLVGWDMQGIDLSSYKKIRIELESSEIKNRIVLRQIKSISI